MVYLTADGTVVEKRSLFRLSLPLDILWGVLDFVSIFFQTLVDPEGAKADRWARGGGATGGGGGVGEGGGLGDGGSAGDDVVGQHTMLGS